MNTPTTYRHCIDVSLRCANACNYTASACTRSSQVSLLARCIRLSLECAALCTAAAQLTSYNSVYAQDICRYCTEACLACAKECGRHQGSHFEACAEACRECAEACAVMAL